MAVSETVPWQCRRPYHGSVRNRTMAVSETVSTAVRDRIHRCSYTKLVLHSSHMSQLYPLGGEVPWTQSVRLCVRSMFRKVGVCSAVSDGVGDLFRCCVVVRWHFGHCSDDCTPYVILFCKVSCIDTYVVSWHDVSFH